MDFTCENCGSEFNRNSHESKDRQRRFCNHKCYGEWLKGKYLKKAPIKAYIKRCPQCYKNFWTKVKKAKFCSRQCYDKFQWHQTKKQCLYCNRDFWVSRANLKRGAGRFCSLKCRYKYYTGKKHPRWKGGISNLLHQIRNFDNCKQWRMAIFLRDNYTCQSCGIRGNYLEAHHKKSLLGLINKIQIMYPLFSIYDIAKFHQPLWEIENGVTVCKSCHCKIEHRRRKNEKTLRSQCRA